MAELLGGLAADADADAAPPVRPLIGARQELENQHERERVDLAISQLGARTAMDKRQADAYAAPAPEVTQPANSATSQQGGDGGSSGAASGAGAAGDASAAADAGTGEGF